MNDRMEVVFDKKRHCGGHFTQEPDWAETSKSLLEAFISKATPEDDEFSGSRRQDVAALLGCYLGQRDGFAGHVAASRATNWRH